MPSPFRKRRRDLLNARLQQRRLERRRLLQFETCEPRLVLNAAPAFDWFMQDGLKADSAGRIVVPNTAEYARPAGFPVVFDVSEFELSTGDRPTTYSFQILDRLGAPVQVGADPAGTLVSPVPSGPIIAGVPQWYAVELPESDESSTAEKDAFSVTISGTKDAVTEAITKPVVVDNILIVAIGDSYGSGEGTPEVARGSEKFGQWMSAGDGTDPQIERANFEHRIAHRSSFAASSQMALQMEQADPKTSVTYVFLAASGGEIAESALASYPGITGEYRDDDYIHSAQGAPIPPAPLPPQLDQLDAIVGDRKIDTLTVSFGGNDVGFANVIAGALFLDPGDPDQAGVAYLQARSALEAAVQQGQAGSDGPWDAFFAAVFPTLSVLPTSAFFDTTTAGLDGMMSAYQQLDVRIKSLLGGAPDQVLITQYPDPFSEWVNGSLKLGDQILDDLFPSSALIGDGFELLFDGPLEITADEMLWAREHVINPLNQAIADAAEELGWTVIDGIGKAWEGHGFTASPSLEPDSNGRLQSIEITAGEPARWIVTPTESVTWQGPASAVDSKGQVHPNRLGSAATGALLYESAFASYFGGLQAKTGDVLPINLRAWLNAQEPGSGDGVAFSNLQLQFVDLSQPPTTWQPLATTIHPDRGDWELFVSDGGEQRPSGYVLFPDRVEANPALTFEDTGRIYFAPATSDVGADYDDDPFQAGFQGTVRITFDAGSDASNLTSHELRVFVAPGYSTASNSTVPVEVPETDPGHGLATMRMQQRLNFLGYVDAFGEPLVIDGVVGPRTMESAGLFNAVVGDAPDVVPMSWVDPLQINRSNAPRWVELPISGPKWWLDASAESANLNWTSNWSLDVLNIAGASGNVPSIPIVLASQQSGGIIDGEVGHATGRDLDIGINHSSSVYRVHGVEGQNYVAAKTPNDSAGDSHVVASVDGPNETVDANLTTLTLFSSGPALADLSQVMASSTSNGNEDAWLRISDPAGDLVLRRIISVDQAAGTVELNRRLPASFAGQNGLIWSAFYSVPLSNVTTASGLVEDQLSNDTNFDLLTGLAPLMTDPVSGYRAADIMAQVEALRRANPESAAQAIRIEFNDPRLWGLPGTISEDNAAGRTSFAFNAANVIQLRTGPGASVEAAAAAVE